MARTLPPAALTVHGYIFDRCGVAALHHVGRGRYLRLRGSSWTRGPIAVPPSAIYLTRADAEAAFRRAREPQA